MNDIASIFVLGSFVVACSAKVPRLPRRGESLRAEAFTLETGGKGLNLAVGARRLGASVDGLLAIGDDAFGNLAAPALARAGLPSVMLRRYPAATGSGIGFTDGDGENCLAVYSGANLMLSGADIRARAAALHRARLVLAQFEIGDEPIIDAFALSRAAGGTTLLNPSPFRISDLRILAQTSILVLNRVEAQQLAATLDSDCGARPKARTAAEMAELAMAFLAHGPDTVIVTLGAEGALACRRDMPPFHQPAFAVEALDSLGAGDAFTAGLAVGLSENRPLEECLRRAAACGALVARRLGVFDALPTGAELEEFLAGAP